jgi:hypothetical protein
MLRVRLLCALLLGVGISTAALDAGVASSASGALMHEAGTTLAAGAPVGLALEAEYCKPSVGEGAWRVAGSVTRNRPFRAHVALEEGEHECRSWNWPGVFSVLALDEAVLAAAHGTTHLTLHGTGVWGFLDCRWEFKNLTGTLTGSEATAEVRGNARHVAGTDTFCRGTRVVEIIATVLGADEMPLGIAAPPAG